nr:siderophore-interacting protein [Micromonospora sp. CNB394]
MRNGHDERLTRARDVDRPLGLRELVILHRSPLTPAMMRITLGGPAACRLRESPARRARQAGLPGSGHRPDPPAGPRRRPVTVAAAVSLGREYTVRRFDPLRGELDIDVVLHGSGLGSDWARQAPPGSTIWVVGPRPARIIPAEFGHHVLLGDETALPAITRWLENLPPSARAVAAIEVGGPDDEQDVSVPAGSTLTWLHRQGAPAGTTGLLAGFAETIPLTTGTHTFVFAAGEAETLKPVRAWVRRHGIGPDQSTISGYWRRGTARQQSTSLAGQVLHRLGHLIGRPR